MTKTHRHSLTNTRSRKLFSLQPRGRLPHARHKAGQDYNPALRLSCQSVAEKQIFINPQPGARWRGSLGKPHLKHLTVDGSGGSGRGHGCLHEVITRERASSDERWGKTEARQRRPWCFVAADAAHLTSSAASLPSAGPLVRPPSRRVTVFPGDSSQRTGTKMPTLCSMIQPRR